MYKHVSTSCQVPAAQLHHAQPQLALHLIDIGYEVLARVLHSDKGGSREAMTRLNDVTTLSATVRLTK